MLTDDFIPAKIVGRQIEMDKHSFFMKYKKNQRHNLTAERFVYYLKSGAISIYRLKDDMLTMELEAPAVVGLSLIKEIMPGHYFRCVSECDFHVLNYSHALTMLNDKNLWKYAFYNVSELVQHYMLRDALVIQKNTHAIVMEHLKIIWSMDKEIRKKTSIYNYILERNIISRSAIHKVVTELQGQNVIAVHRGKLTVFNDC
jgi:CRP-like cAMP-binding protein